MNIPRTVALGVIGGSVAVWLAAAATSTARRPAPRAEPKSRAVEASGAALASEVARLHDRLRPTATPTQTRDLFRYGRRSATRSAGGPAVAAAAPPAPVAAAPAVVSAPLILVGIAEDTTENGVVRTAIVSGFGELFMVREQETITSRFRVKTVSAEGVELTDTSDQSTLRLVLR